MKVRVALVTAVETPEAARSLIGTNAPYRGTWEVPTPEHPTVYVFTEHSPEELLSKGWRWITQ